MPAFSAILSSQTAIASMAVSGVVAAAGIGWAFAGGVSLNGISGISGMRAEPSPTVTLGPEASAGDFYLADQSLPVFVLVGGQQAFPADSFIFADGNIGLGELFVLPQQPLDPHSVYEIGITARTVSGTGGVNGSAAGDEQFSTTWQFSTGGNSSAGGQGYYTALDEANAFRASAGLAPLAWDDNYAIAAAQHAGYQRLENTLSHEQTNPDNPLYVAPYFNQRISQQVGGEFYPQLHYGTDIDVVYENISTMGSPVAAVRHLWNSVYHRLPIYARHHHHHGRWSQWRCRLCADAIN